MLALVVATALLASCSSSPTAAAAVTVNGTDLADSDFRDELELLTQHPEFAQGVFGVGPDTDSDNAVGTDFAAEVLTLRVLVMLIEDEFEARGLTLTEDDLAAADETFLGQLQELLAAMPEDYRNGFRDWNAKLIVLRTALADEAAERSDEVSDDDVRAFFDDFRGVFSSEEVCARHILVDTEAEADAVIADLADDADFAELATERSTDPSAQGNQGDLGCAGRGQYVPEFEEAVWDGPIGEVQGPIQTTFGYHVILVDSRGEQTFESVEADIRAFLESPASRDGQQLLNLWLQQAIADADVQVNSRYGEWDAASQSITPPAGPTTTIAG
jgi:parvulin-like peptidyl-prolyl isomerase